MNAWHFHIFSSKIQHIKMFAKVIDISYSPLWSLVTEMPSNFFFCFFCKEGYFHNFLEGISRIIAIVPFTVNYFEEAIHLRLLHTYICTKMHICKCICVCFELSSILFDYESACWAAFVLILLNFLLTFISFVIGPSNRQLLLYTKTPWELNCFTNDSLVLASTPLHIPQSLYGHTKSARFPSYYPAYTRTQTHHRTHIYFHNNWNDLWG